VFVDVLWAEKKGLPLGSGCMSKSSIFSAYLPVEARELNLKGLYWESYGSGGLIESCLDSRESNKNE
jgi:hypothetical protein